MPTDAAVNHDSVTRDSWSQRLDAADAAWLHMDRPTNLMIVNSVFWFDEPMDWTALCEVLEQRLVTPFVRFRQLVSDPPVTLGPLGGPRWRFDPAFSLDRHVVRARLAEPGDRAALQDYVSEQASRPLAKDRPLWEAHLLDGYHPRGPRGGRGKAASALLLRTHHAVADGAALIQVVLSMTEPASGTPLKGGASQLRLADPAASPVSVDVGQLGKAVGRVFGAGRLGVGVAARAGRFGVGAVSGVARLAASPTAVSTVAQRQAFTAVAVTAVNAKSLLKLGGGLSPERNLFRGELGIRKEFAWSEPVPLDTVRSAAKAAGGTVNDAVLTVITGALRRYLEEHDAVVDKVRAMCPVDLRPADRPLSRELGNRFGLVFVALPVGLDDRRARFADVQQQMQQIKAGREATAMLGGISLLGLTPARHENAWIDAVSGRASLLITNVQGPREAVTLAGTRLAGSIGWVPMSGPIGVGISVHSYAGSLTLGVSTDAGLVPDDGVLLQALEDELAAVGELAG